VQLVNLAVSQLMPSQAQAQAQAQAPAQAQAQVNTQPAVMDAATFNARHKSSRSLRDTV
jgi:hypothetical protein